MCPMCIGVPETTTGLDAKAVTEGGDERWLRYLHKLMRLTCSQRCILVCKNVWVRFGMRNEGQLGNREQFHHIPYSQMDVIDSKILWSHVEAMPLNMRFHTFHSPVVHSWRWFDFVAMNVSVELNKLQCKRKAHRRRTFDSFKVMNFSFYNVRCTLISTEHHVS